MRFRLVSSLLVPLLLAHTAIAQSERSGDAAEAPNGETIIVTGSRVTDEAVSDFVEALTVETSGDQLAAFHAPICPMSMGLPEAFNRVIEQRIRTVAEQAGIDVAGEDCSPNITVFIADNGADLISRLRSEYPSLFAGRDASANRGLVLQAGPVRAWQVLDVRGSDGRPVQRINFLDARGLPRGSVFFLPRGKFVDGGVSSTLTRSTRQDLAFSYVVIDVAAIDGLSLVQVADHAAMRALAQTDPEDANATGQPTILTLFADRPLGQAAPTAITEWDKAFLKSLYETRRTVSAGLQRSNMARIVREELEADKPNP